VLAYIPKTDWKLEDTVTERDFNRIEGGIKEALAAVDLVDQKDTETLNEAKQYTDQKVDNIEVPVKSVNGKTGDVVLAAVDIQTGNGKDVETTINELFTSVSDGKDKVAKAITDQGVPAVKEDTFPDLATKIKQINTGKKWAEGTIPRRNLDYGETYYLDVNQLEFKPSMILMEYKLADEHPGTLQHCRMYTEIFDIRKMNEVEISLSSNGNRIGKCEPFSIQDNGFSVLVYKAPNNSNKRKVWGSWYASE
jgi:hypothetical protein